MRAGSREHGSHLAMITPRIPLHLGRPSRVQRYSSNIHIAMEEDSLMTRYDDGVCLLRECDGVRLTAMLLWGMDEVW